MLSDTAISAEWRYLQRELEHAKEAAIEANTKGLDISEKLRLQGEVYRISDMLLDMEGAMQPKNTAQIGKKADSKGLIEKALDGFENAFCAIFKAVGLFFLGLFGLSLFGLWMTSFIYTISTNWMTMMVIDVVFFPAGIVHGFLILLRNL